MTTEKEIAGQVAEPEEALRLVLGGRAITVAPVRVGSLPAFLRAVEPIARELAQGDVLAALAREADRLIEATAIGAGVERAWLEAQSVDALAELAAAVVEVNAGFFVRRVLPAIERAGAALGQGASSARAPGGTSS